MDAATRIRQLGTILGVWAHPDDEVFSCAGILAIAATNGQRVMCMTATRGELGVQDELRWPQAKLGEIRTKELQDAYRILGISEHCWFDFPDGGVNLIDEKEGLRAVEQCIEQCHPDTILTFGPDGMTGHQDHQTVSSWATKLAKKYSIAVYHAVLTPESYQANVEADEQFNMFFNIDKPPIVPPEACDLLIELDEITLKKKCEALKAMPSQTERMIAAMGEEKLCNMQRTEAFLRA